MDDDLLFWSSLGFQRSIKKMSSLCIKVIFYIVLKSFFALILHKRKMHEQITLLDNLILKNTGASSKSLRGPRVECLWISK